MTTIYHIAHRYELGTDLVSLALMVDRGCISRETAARYARRKWPEYPDYMLDDGCYVHCHATLADAQEYQAEYGGVILAVDTDYLDGVGIGTEYPHPVVRGSIPARCITPYAPQRAHHA